MYQLVASIRTPHPFEWEDVDVILPVPTVQDCIDHGNARLRLRASESILNGIGHVIRMSIIDLDRDREEVGSWERKYGWVLDEDER